MGSFSRLSLFGNAASVEFRMIIQLGSYKLPGYNQCRSKRFIMGSAKYVSETTSMAV